MTHRRPEIPAAMKRQVRQRCGFGCVICGLPLYEYEHMQGYASVKRHRAEELTLLCDRHHKERTNGLLTREQVQDANNAPYNKTQRNGHSLALHYEGNRALLELGPTVVVRRIGLRDGDRMIAVAIDRHPMLGFTFEDGHLLVSLNLLGEDGSCLVQIQRSELLVFPNSWDIEFVGRRLCVRNAPREIVLDICFHPQNTIKIAKAQFVRNNREVLIDGNGVHLLRGKYRITIRWITIEADVAVSYGEKFLDRTRCAFAF